MIQLYIQKNIPKVIMSIIKVQKKSSQSYKYSFFVHIFLNWIELLLVVSFYFLVIVHIYTYIYMKLESFEYFENNAASFAFDN